jgi:HK97 family phage prohead protease
MLISLAEAAERRAAGVRAPADRPSQRRAHEDSGAGVTRGALSKFDVRAAQDDTDGLLTFEGYASVYETPYEMYDAFGPYTEVVSRGAGAASLNRADISVPLVLDHDPMRRIASTDNGTLTVRDIDEGLHVLAPALDPSDHDVAYIVPKLRSGLITEMSFRFRIIRGVWSPDYTEYRIDEFDIHRGDVAIVGYGANPFTAGAGLREQKAQHAERVAPPVYRGIDLVREYDIAHRR